VKKTLILTLSVWAAFSALGCSRERAKSVEMMNRGVENFQRNQIPLAIQNLTRAITLDPENEKAHHNLAMIYMQNKDYTDAVTELQKAISLNGKEPVYQYQMGECYYWMDQYDQALPYLQKAVEFDPGLYRAHYWIGRIYQFKDQPQMALNKYTEALHKGPRFFDAYRELGSLYGDLGFLEQSEQVLKEGIRAVEGKAEDAAILYARLGNVYQEKKQYEQAIKAFREALANNPKMSDMFFDIGWTYSLMNDKDMARMWLEKFVKSANLDVRPDVIRAAQERLIDLGGGTQAIR